MAACSSIDWDMELILDKDPATSETIGFRQVQINNGVITGKVFDEATEEMSPLRGTCTASTAAGGPDMSHLTFIFNVKDKRGVTIKIILIGVATLPPGGVKEQFRGGFRAVAPFNGDPSIMNGQLDMLAIDPGDTGTGNGSQT